MAKTKTNTKRKNKKSKSKKINPVLLLLLIFAIALVGVGLYFVYKHYDLPPARDDNSTSSSLVEDDPNATSISFHFLELGNANTGDCTYIKAGDIDILIDAGSAKNSAPTISSYLSQPGRVEDGKLEYVFVTHAHTDHISGFVGSKNEKLEGGRDGLLYQYKVDNLIDFSYYEDSSKKIVIDNANPDLSIQGISTIYKEYVEARNYAVSKGTKWQTVGNVWKNEENRSVTLGNNLSFDYLYNFFYDHTSKDVKELDPKFSTSNFSSQNDMSICLRFKQGQKSFIFTGDAEEYAEYSLVKFNQLSQASLFKGGHHGSYTASSQILLDKIKPSTVCVCCCAGNKEYAKDINHSFPAQEFIDRIAPFTDKVYVTSLGSWDDPKYHVSFNGNIKVSYSFSQEVIECSNNDTKLKDTDWFKANRKTPLSWQ